MPTSILFALQYKPIACIDSAQPFPISSQPTEEVP